MPACVLLVASGLLGDYATQVVDDGAQLAGALFAAACCWSTWRRGGPAGRFAPERAWRLLLALGIGGWACGQALWSWYQLVEGRPLPSPSLADVGYFALPLFAVPGVLLLATSSPPADETDDGRGPPEPAPRVRRARLLLSLDALVIVGSLVVLAWATSLGAVVRAGAPSAAEFAVAIAYPVTDLVLVVIVLLTVVFRRPRHPRVLLLLGAGLVALAASDSCFFYLVSTGAQHMPPLLDTGFIAGPVLIGLAALAPEPGTRPAGARRRTRDARLFVLLPYVPLGAIGLLVVVQQATGSEVDRVETAGLLVLAGVVVVRQLLTLLENLDLLRRVREGQERLQHQAFHDWLTGLPNRALFRERLESAVEGHRRGGRLAVLFVDLDDFKQVNDSFGHAAGDELLKVTAQRLRAGLADGDTAARLGGDEFAVVLAGAAADGRESAAAAGERLAAALGRPVVLAGGTVVPRVSAGLVVAEPGGPPVTAELVLHQADVAMYAAKHAGKGQVVTRSTTGEAGEEDLPTRLGRALHEATDRPGPLRLVHQPIVRLADGARVAVEALVRWEQDGAVAPEVLVQAAETAGLAGRLQQWLLREACRDLAALRAGGDPSLAVHVNVPASLLAADAVPGGDLAAAVATALAAHGLPGSAMVLEITETGRIDDFSTAAAVLERVRALGVRVALDDFGAGHSNLNHLLRLPVDILKLDRALVAGVGNAGRRSRALSSGAVQMARGLGIPVVAEGVERPQQAALLAELGCQYAQGYFFSPPLPAARLSPSPVAGAARPSAEGDGRPADLQTARAVRAW